MQGKYKVITLCGSTRFKDEFMEAQKRLTLEGNIVISVGLFGHSGDEEVWEGMDEGTATATKKMLDEMHKRKIDMADEIFVVNVGGYIGDSTRSEIEYAKDHGKHVRYLEQTTLDDINDVVGAINSGVDPKTGERINVDSLINRDGFKEVINTIYHKINQHRSPEPNGDSTESRTEVFETEKSVQALIEQAIVLKKNKEWENAIILLTNAYSKSQDKRQKGLIISDIVRCYVEMGAVEQANNYYIDARKKYGRGIVDVKTLTYIASLLEYRKDYMNAKKYSIEAYNLSQGNPSQALTAIIDRLRKVGAIKTDTSGASKQGINANLSKDKRTAEKIDINNQRQKKSQSNTRPQSVTSTSEQKGKSSKVAMDEYRQQLKMPIREDIKRACKNCKLYVKGDCAGLKGLCADYEYAPVISDEEKKSWPASMQGPYGRNYGRNRRR